MKKGLVLLASAALVAGSLTASAVSAKKVLQVKGSDTLVHLSSAWAENFMKKHPNVEVAVTGGGSGTGIAALLNGTADLANASRKIKDKEVKLAGEKGMDIKEHVVALDGIGVIVNPDNPIDALSMEQLKDIFTGKVTNWKKAGGPNKGIVLFTRDSSSGTFAFFQKRVLKKEDYAVKSRRLPSNSAIVQSVADDKYAIGYVGLGYVAEAGDKIKALAVKVGDKKGVKPTQKTVAAGDYPISRGLQIYSNGEPKGDAKTFMDYIMSDAGQDVVSEMGFVPVK